MRIVSFVVLCMILFLGSVGLADSTHYLTQDTIYVDDDNINGPWDGSFDHPFQFIQDGVNTATNGDIVEVLEGIYTEQIIIQTGISLIGDPGTIIQGDEQHSSLLIQADDVVLSGFIFSDGGDRLNASCDIAGDDCIISENVFYGEMSVGIAIHDSSNGLIENNMISDCGFAGIHIHGNSEKNVITQNQVDECSSGIYCFRSSDQLISQNRVSNASKGIYLEECTACLIERNVVIENSQGIFASYASDNLITENNVLSNVEQAKLTTWLSPEGLPLSRWVRNYWDDIRGVFPKWIPGLLFIPTNDPIGIFLPWGAFDWHPASEPYVIDTGDN